MNADNMNRKRREKGLFHVKQKSVTIKVSQTTTKMICVYDTNALLLNKKKTSNFPNSITKVCMIQNWIIEDTHVFFL